MKNLTFGSVCSGIEAASVAWHPLGWKAAWLSEIEPFPCAVLAHHYPGVPNHGDMTTLPGRILAGEVEAPDLFTGGTPCQAFSVAGKRQSLDDARGNLSLTFCEIANAIDHVRATNGRESCIVVWENVPGVLSTSDNAFGCFLGALAGSGCELQPAGGRWTDAGVVLGPQRAVAWRVLDAQYFGLAQRRRRVFVVASAREGFDPAAVLLEFDGVRRDSAPRREAGERVAACLGACPAASSQPNVGNGQGNVVEVMALDAYNQEDTGDLSKTIAARNDQDTASLIAMALPETVGTLCADTHPGSYTGQDAYTGRLIPTTAHTLRGEGFDASEDGTGRGTPLVPVPIQNATRGKDQNGLGIGGEVMFTLDQGSQHGVAIPFDTTQITSAANYSNPKPGDPCHPLAAGAHAPAIPFHANAQADQLPDSSRDTSVPDALTCSQQVAVAQHMAVRRLTPGECEALQGFSRGYTLIPWRGKPADQCPDGPRYKALGNSWAVPCVRWIGERIVKELDA